MEDKFCAEKFVDDLLKHGAIIPCDETSDNFRKSIQNVPEFYEEEKFKKGQQFYHHYIFGMFLNKLMGLITILAIPTILDILKFTKQSSEPLTAYRRYLSTIFHTHVWYKDDFKPGSKTWNSLLEIRGKHKFASKHSYASGANFISQMDMALTQFGFMGFTIARSNLVGIFEEDKSKFEAFIHVWRVIGRVVGIEDRFNICRDSYEETKEICEVLITKVFRPKVEEQREDFVSMATALIEGMWCMMPMLSAPIFMTYLRELLRNGPPSEEENKVNMVLSRVQRFHYWVIKNAISTYKYFILRVYHNTSMYLSLWLMKHFPFLALYKFGKKNSYVKILQNVTQERKSG